MNGEGARHGAPDPLETNRLEDTAPPTLTLVFPLEGHLRIEHTCRDQGEIERLKDWFRSHEALRRLVSDACSTIEKQQAA